MIKTKDLIKIYLFILMTILYQILKNMELILYLLKMQKQMTIIAIVKQKIREENKDLPIYIITNDHDYLQLFDDNTYIYNLKGLNLRTKSR